MQFLHYARHLKTFYEYDSGFAVECNIDGCKALYSKVDSYNKHVNRQHKFFL